ncbi:S8 family serine peptidase [Arthrobacter sp.]|uniref:S8 family serine peptidase n=1 Tax=Arthrobacter sp. TaxID=1667 RepID=UPI003A95C2D8
MLDPDFTGPSGQRTGRYIVVFDDDEPDPLGVLASGGLTRIASTRDLGALDTAQARADAMGGTAGTFFAELNMAVVDAADDELAGLRTRAIGGAPRLRMYPELIHHVLSPATGRHRSADDDDGQTAFADTDAFTWGLLATHAAQSPYSGHGIKVAVLDTGFDETHPDFAGRTVVTQSFVDGEGPHDGHGHGTHCIGTSCGPRTLADGRGYGIAFEADIYAGKVLSNEGSGSDAGILAGIDWAISQGCAVISMSLGADVNEIHPPYVAAGKRALAQGTLIVAAAGNNAQRSAGNPGFVGTPANSPYILAVAAVDDALAVADFSARSSTLQGGQVDVAGPGVNVYSSWPMPQRYNTISGTSMATPHAAGVSALLAESTGLRGRELWAELVQVAERLEAPSVDVGSGLVTAPQAAPPDPQPADPGDGDETP